MSRLWQSFTPVFFFFFGSLSDQLSPSPLPPSLPPCAPPLRRVSAFNPLCLDSAQRQKLIGLSDAAETVRLNDISS